MAIARFATPVGAATTGTVEVDDTTPGVSPTVTFTYTLTRDRTEASGANFFYMFKPVSYPDLTPKTCAELKALVTIKVNGTTQVNEDFIEDAGVCSVWTGGIQMRLKAGATLTTGDVVTVILAPGVLTNTATVSSTTWTWRTSDSGGGNSDDFTATLVTGDTTTTTAATSTTTTTTPPGGGGSDGSGSGGSGEPEDLSDSGVDALTLTALAAALLSTGLALRRRTRPT